MKLDRNQNSDKMGKYALIKLRPLRELMDASALSNYAFNTTHPVGNALTTLAAAGMLDWGDTPDTDFFVIRLKDKYAAPALKAYALAAEADDLEYAEEIRNLMHTAAKHPNQRNPD